MNDYRKKKSHSWLFIFIRLSQFYIFVLCHIRLNHSRLPSYFYQSGFYFLLIVPFIQKYPPTIILITSLLHILLFLLQHVLFHSSLLHFDVPASMNSASVPSSSCISVFLLFVTFFPR